jgi:ribosome-binding protein aMBF1 (putative translation factor)
MKRPKFTDAHKAEARLVSDILKAMEKRGMTTAKLARKIDAKTWQVERWFSSEDDLPVIRAAMMAEVLGYMPQFRLNPDPYAKA